MKNRQLLRSLVDLGYYSVLYDEQPTDADMSIVGDSGIIRKVTDNSIPDNDLNLMMQAEQLKYLKSIKTMMFFLVILVVIAICITIYFGCKTASIY